MSQYNLSIITPNGKIFEDKISSLTAPGSEGSFGILSHHSPMIAQLKKGVLAIKQNTSEQFYTIGSGVLEVNHLNEVLVLANTAVPSADIKEAG